MEENLQIEVTSRASDASSTVVVAGELDADTCPRLESIMTRVDGSIVVDVRGLDFIDSSGISTLLDRRARAIDSGHSFSVEGATGQVAKVFSISGVDALFSL